MTEFLADAGERITILKVVCRRVLNRYTALVHSIIFFFSMRWVFTKYNCRITMSCVATKLF